MKWISQKKTARPLITRVGFTLLLLAVGWSGAVIFSLLWNIHLHGRETRELALYVARTHLENEDLYRRWNAANGGVYVPVTRQTPPEPMLASLPEREIIAPSGRVLTLASHVNMIQQMRLGKEAAREVASHVAGLRPLSSDYQSDFWETTALDALRLGEDEVASQITEGGVEYLRLMRAFRVEEGCLKCHAGQGYGVGEVAGGLSVKLPMAVFSKANARQIVILTRGHGIWWLLGLFGIGFSYVAMHRSIMERESAEAELKQVTARLEQTLREVAAIRLYLRNVIDSMPSVLIGVDNNAKVTQWNNEAEKVVGLSAEAVRGRLLSEVCQGFSPWMDRIRNAVLEKSPLRAEKIASPLQQGGRYVDIIIYPLSSMEIKGAVIRIDDVTERVHLEDRMIQSEKMITVAGLVEGMAHEINNPLGGIIQGTQSVLRRLSINIPKNYEVAENCGTDLIKIREYMQQRDIFKFLEGIKVAGHRAASIIHYMLQFSTGGDVGTETRDLAEIISHSIRLVAENQDLKSRIDFSLIEFVTGFDPQLPKVRCSVASVETVLLNLIENAAQVLYKQYQEGDATSRPRIVIRTVKEATMARVEVEDNGPGMDEKTRRRVFEPFFTTREPGEGTGLGLTVSYFIITVAHQGTMSVESTPGAGAKFIFRLPLA